MVPSLTATEAFILGCNFFLVNYIREVVLGVYEESTESLHGIHVYSLWTPQSLHGVHGNIWVSVKYSCIP
jgi:hypothetical protein